MNALPLFKVPSSDNSMLTEYTPRDYQLSLIQKAEALLSQKQRVMVQAPTGAGKTVIFSHLAKNQLEQGNRITIVAHRAELIYQTAEKIESICGIKPGLVIPQRKPNYDSPVQIVMKDTAKNRLNLLPPADLTIIDEAHHAICKSYEAIINHSPNTKLLGFSATPTRNDGQGFRGILSQHSHLRQSLCYVSRSRHQSRLHFGKNQSPRPASNSRSICQKRDHNSHQLYGIHRGV